MACWIISRIKILQRFPMYFMWKWLQVQAQFVETHQARMWKGTTVSVSSLPFEVQTQESFSAAC